MNIFNKVKSDLVKILNDKFDVENGVDSRVIDRVTVENPKDRSHGDLATNIAMVSCKEFKTNPRKLAEELVSEIEKIDYVEKAEIAGPGFINLKLKPTIWQEAVKEILVENGDYGIEDLGKGEKVNVEYVSANPTGPIHIGHTRGSIFGDVLANVLEKVGYDVTKEYYINDAGGQINTLVKSAYLRYLEALGEEITIPEGCYPGAYLIPTGKMLVEKFGESLKGMDEEEYYSTIRDHVVESMMDLIREDLKIMNIKHDVYFSEKKNLHDTGAIQGVSKFLEDRGLVYEGVTEAPKGKVPADFKPEKKLLFKSTEFGDDEDRVVFKADGTATYFAADIAYAKDKFDRGFKKTFVVLGADHGGYVKRMKAVTKAVSNGECEAEVFLVNLIKLFENGEPFKMSKRSGKFITARDMAEEVGKDILRFIIMTRQNTAPIDFDFQKVKEQSKDNPVFYVQYAYARGSSVLRKAKEEGINIPTVESLSDVNLSLLGDEAEIELIKKLVQYPKIVSSAAKSYELHKLAFYSQEIASEFHSLWNKGGQDDSLKFIQVDNEELTKARLCLIQATLVILKSCLGLLGVEPMEEMR